MIRPLFLVALTGCIESSPPEIPPSRVFGGVEISGEVLAEGRRGYETVCASCHGAQGHGDGRLGLRQQPKPRNFSSGVIKFASVRAGSLWRDEDVMQILKHGLAGTQMMPFKIPDVSLRPIVHHLKTFSPRWSHENTGVAVPVSLERDPGPLPGHAALLYRDHCASCHETERKVDTIWGTVETSPRLHGYRFKVGSDPTVLYRTLAAGVGGIKGKSPLVDLLPPEDIWALVHHVRALSEQAVQ